MCKEWQEEWRGENKRCPGEMWGRERESGTFAHIVIQRIYLAFGVCQALS